MTPPRAGARSTIAAPYRAAAAPYRAFGPVSSRRAAR